MTSDQFILSRLKMCSCISYEDFNVCQQLTEKFKNTFFEDEHHKIRYCVSRTRFIWIGYNTRCSCVDEMVALVKRLSAEHKIDEFG